MILKILPPPFQVQLHDKNSYKNTNKAHAKKPTEPTRENNFANVPLELTYKQKHMVSVKLDNLK